MPGPRAITRAALTALTAAALMSPPAVSSAELAPEVDADARALVAALASLGDLPSKGARPVVGARAPEAPERPRARPARTRRPAPAVRPASAPVRAPSTCVASWYGDAFAGRRTASGSRFDPDALTAAHRTLPFGTRLEVVYGSRSVVVTITDRGPYVGGRCLDLSEEAFSRLAPTSRGLLAVRWRRV